MTASAEAALTRIALADDFTVTAAFFDLQRQLERSAAGDAAQLAEALPAELTAIEGEGTLGFLDSAAERDLDGAASIAVARQLFVLAAQDDATAQLVSEVFDGFRDDRQMVGEILAIGAVGAVWLMIASTTFSFGGSSGKIEKRPVSAKVITAFADVIKALRGAK